MELDCFVIDDEFTATVLIGDMIKKTPGLNLLGYETDAYTACMKIINKEIEPDIVFLDVHMEGLSGIEIAGLITNQTEVNVVFVTGDSKVGTQAFSHRATYYITKPFTYPEFLTAVERVREKIDLINRAKAITQYKEEPALSGKFAVKGEGKKHFILIDWNEIIFIKSASNYNILYLDNGKPLFDYGALAELSEKLSSKGFMQVHRSYLVNLKKIVKVYGNAIVLTNGEELEIGPSYREMFFAVIEKHRY